MALTRGGSNLLYEALFSMRFLPMVSQRRDVTQPFCNPLEVEMIDGGLVTVAREASQRRSQLGVDELEMKFRKGSTRV
jgi:hypothetical protein